MNKIFSILLLTSLLLACNTESTQTPKEDQKSSDKTEKQESEEKESDDEFISSIPIEGKAALITTALQAVAKDKRDSCTVKGYNADGEFVTYKEGTNEIICLADDPRKDGFSVASYHKSLEPFMARGRVLKEEGKDGREIFKIREKEVKSGELKMGDAGSTLHVYYGPKAEYNAEKGTVPGAAHRFVVYLPFATSESTGLPEIPQSPDHPWIMDPGTHKAHVMITPKK